MYHILFNNLRWKEGDNSDLYQPKVLGKLAADPRIEFVPSDFKSNILYIAQWPCPLWNKGYCMKLSTICPHSSKMKQTSILRVSDIYFLNCYLQILTTVKFSYNLQNKKNLENKVLIVVSLPLFYSLAPNCFPLIL